MINAAPDFIPGLKLSAAFYREAVRPILDAVAPGLPHSAARIGPGSEVLGFDTPQSTDHDWGPRCELFLSEAAYAQQAAIDQALRERLPHTFRGYPTDFSPPNAEGTRLLAPAVSGPVAHRVELYTVRGFFREYVGYDPEVALTPVDWLTLAEQKLLTITQGAVFHDDLGLAQIRVRLAYYPHDVWLYLLAAEWMKLSQEEPFMGRCGEVGDDLGSQLIAARLVHTAMRLAFLMERRYPPYSKWFGSAFARLGCAPALLPLLEQAIQGRTWREREGFLAQAYTVLARKHNALKITAPLPTEVSSFHERPYLVIHGERFAQALLDAIDDPVVCALPPFVGAVDQFVNSTDVLSHPARCQRLQALFA